MRSDELPYVRLADGFSCRTQLAHGTDRRALHLAQTLDARFAQDV